MGPIRRQLKAARLARAKPARRAARHWAEVLEARWLLAAAPVSINFQPAGAATPSGYLADTGSVYGDRGNGHSYGWDQSISTATRDRNSATSLDQRYDTLVHTQLYGTRTWELGLPNGAYSVHVVAGDPSNINSVYRVNAENVLAVNGTPNSTTHWIEGTVNVTVSDGRLTLSNATGSSNNKLCYVDVSPIIASTQHAYKNIVPSIPGLIQAENFDEGGAGVAYSDTTAGNLGSVYRTGDVDLTPSSDTGGGYSVGWTRSGEWLEYTVDVPTAGTYSLEARVASKTGGTFHVEFGGVNKTGALTLPNTGGWQTWTTVTRTGVSLSAGRQIMRLQFDSSAGGGDIGDVNWLRLSDPGVPTLTISAPDASASEAGPNTGTFTISRTGSTASAIGVKYNITGTATEVVDYNDLPGFVTIPAGSSSANVVITPASDTLAEGDETVTLTIYNADVPFNVGGSGSATVTIRDEDIHWPTSFTVAAPAPTGRWETSSHALNGKIYVEGGWVVTSTIGTKKFEVYDVAANKWTSLPDAPIPETHAEVAVDEANNVIYYAGGYFGDYPGTATNRVWKFNATTGAWSELPSMPTPMSAGGLALVNGQLHYFGGSRAEGTDANVSDHYVLNLNGGTSWTAAAAMPNPRDHFSTIVLNNKIYAIGGEFGHDKLHQQVALVSVYDTITSTWSSAADMPVRKSHAEAATFLLDGRIVVAGGMVDNFASTSNVVMYEPANNTWVTLPPLPLPLQGTVVQHVGNQIIITTGNTGDRVGRTTTWVGNLV